MNNGLALCSVHHSAFDKGAIGIDDNLAVRVSGGINRSPMVEKLFWDCEGEKLFQPKDKTFWPAEKFIEWHQTQVFKP